MFERRCECCKRSLDWSDRAVQCSDKKLICFNCLKFGNIHEPPLKELGKMQPWPSIMVLERIMKHFDYEDFCKKSGTEVLLGGQLLINEQDHTFAIGCDDYDKQLTGFQSGSYEKIESISINDGVQTKSIKVSDGDSGAAGALFGGLVFGPLGAVVGGLSTRENEQYQEVQQTDNIGFTIIHTNTSHDNFNVLKLCLNYDFVNYETQRDVYEAAKELAVKICDELLKRVDKLKPKADTQDISQQTLTVPPVGNVNINPNNIEPTITRIELFLEDGEWDQVVTYSNAALDFFPTDYRPYLFLLLADLRVSSIDELENINKSFSDSKNFKKLKRFADPGLIEKLEAYSESAGIREKVIKEKEEEEEKRRARVLQQEKAKQEEEQAKLEQANLEAYVLGDYRGKPLVSAPWTATTDYLSCKGKKLYYKDILRFELLSIPDDPSRMGLLLCTTPLEFPRLHYSYEEKNRVIALVDYVQERMRTAKKAARNEKKEADYCRALQLSKEGNFEEAYLIFSRLDDYRDSRRNAALCEEKISSYCDNDENKRTGSEIKALLEERNQLLRNKDIGDRLLTLETELLSSVGIQRNPEGTFTFSLFNNEACVRNDKLVFNGNNEWLIVGRDIGKILLLSKYSVKDEVVYSPHKDCNWYESSGNIFLNRGLQDERLMPFVPFKMAFDKKHREIIKEILVFSSNEIKTYMPNAASRILTTKDGLKKQEWLLRDPNIANKITIVDKAGNITPAKNFSMLHGSYMYALRPALWIDLNKLVS